MRTRWIALAFVMLLFSRWTFGQAASVPIDVDFPHIVVGGDAAGANFVTLIQVVNNNSADVAGHLELFAENGSALAAQIDGAAGSTLDFTLASGESRQMQLRLDGPLTTGWMHISYSPSDALTTVVLQYRSGPALLSEVGVDPQSVSLSATDFAIETDEGLDTGLALANPSATTTYVLAAIWDPATGVQSSSKIISLPPHSHFSQFATELFSDVAGIHQLRAKISLDSCLDPSCFRSGLGFLATAIRLNGDQFTTVPLAPAVAGGNLVRILPQVAFGGDPNGLNMKTVLYFTTTVPTGVFAAAEIFDDAGNPLAASADGAVPSSSLTITVPGNRVTRVVLSGDSTLRAGWLRLTLPSSVNLVANAVFQTYTGPGLISEAGVRESPARANGLTEVNVQPGAANVGLAIANPDVANSAAVALHLFSDAGWDVGERDVTLAPNGHFAGFVTDLFPAQDWSAGFTGAVSISGGAGVSALALRLTSGKIATLPLAANGMFRPSIRDLRVTKTQRTVPAQVQFSIDVADFNSDLATSSSSTVSGFAWIDFGSVSTALGTVTLDGSGMIGASTGTLTGTFQPTDVTGAIPANTPAVLYVQVNDSAGNASNFIGVQFKF